MVFMGNIPGLIGTSLEGFREALDQQKNSLEFQEALDCHTMPNIMEDTIASSGSQP